MIEQQRVLMIAALAGADPRTVRKQIVGGKPAHGAVLRQRITDAARQVDSITRDETSSEKSAGRRTPSNA